MADIPLSPDTKIVVERRDLAQRIAACGPLGIKTALQSSYLPIVACEAAAFAELDEQLVDSFVSRTSFLRWGYRSLHTPDMPV